MSERKLFQARCKKCGEKVTSEWKDYDTYPGVFGEDGEFIHGFEDESVYTGDSDKNDSGLWCNGCEVYIEQDDVEPAEEYVPKQDKLDAVKATLELLRDMYDVDFVRNVFGNRIDEAQFNLANEFGLVENKDAVEEVPGQVVVDDLSIEDMEE